MTRTKAVCWPAIPKRIMGAGGPITVRLVKRPRGDDGSDAWGTWQPDTRTIRIERGAPIAHKWRVLYHEIVHSALHDAGLTQLLTDDAEEALCEAISSARIVEMRGAL